MKRTFSAVLLIVVAGGALHFVAVERAAGSNGLRTVAITGDAVPGVEAGATYAPFAIIDAAPVINNSGHVAFMQHLSGTGSFANDSGIWSEGGGSGLALVAREGSPAPGTDVNFSDFYGTQIVMNGSGQVAFDHQFDLTLPVTSLNDNGIWSEGGGGLALVAREGNAAAGTAANFDSLFDANTRLNDSGQVAFRGAITGAGFPLGVWSGGGGSGLALVALEGNAAPGTAAGVTFSSFHLPLINSSGNTAFRATLALSGPGVNLSNDDGIWSEGSGGSLALVAREGGVAPGVGPGLTFAGFSSNGPLAFNSAGRTAFFGFLSGAGVDLTNQGAIWREDDSGLALVARAGDHAPGTGPGVNLSFNTFTESLALNDNGHVAFWATLQGAATGDGIWSDGGGNGIELVARTGSQAPGAGPGVTFNFFANESIELNNRGQTAFWAALSGPGINAANDNGLWAHDGSGELMLIVREGDLLDVSDDPLNPDLRMVSAISRLADNTGNGDGRASSFNDLGQLAFVARFSDGSEGVFVSNLVAVPEPSSILMLVSLGVIWFSLRRRPLLSAI